MHVAIESEKGFLSRFSPRFPPALFIGFLLDFVFPGRAMKRNDVTRDDKAALRQLAKVPLHYWLGITGG